MAETTCKRDVFNGDFLVIKFPENKEICFYVDENEYHISEKVKCLYILTPKVYREVARGCKKQIEEIKRIRQA